jgi:hypothetical protein
VEVVDDFGGRLALRTERGAASRSSACTGTLARACRKSHVLNLEPEDMVALTLEAAAMARVPLAGTDWIPGWNGR